MDEIWVPVVGYEGFYEVSNKGRVRSVERTFANKIGRVRTFPSRLLTPTRGRLKPHYFFVCLSRNSKGRSVTVHRLVALAFLGTPPMKNALALHRDGDALNNTPENLYWGDHSQNTKDAVAHGTNAAAARTHCPQGHPYDAENTRFTTSGGRVCRTCHRNRERAARRQRGPRS